MEMHKEKYEDLMLRFAKELHEVGVTEDMRKIIEAQYERTPHLVACTTNSDVRKFHYRHDGYIIEAVRTVVLTVKKC
jgi:adenylate kinase